MHRSNEYYKSKNRDRNSTSKFAALSKRIGNISREGKKSKFDFFSNLKT